MAFGDLRPFLISGRQTNWLLHSLLYQLLIIFMLQALRKIKSDRIWLPFVCVQFPSNFWISPKQFRIEGNGSLIEFKVTTDRSRCWKFKIACLNFTKKLSTFFHFQSRPEFFVFIGKNWKWSLPNICQPCECFPLLLLHPLTVGMWLKYLSVSEIIKSDTRATQNSHR